MWPVYVVVGVACILVVALLASKFIKKKEKVTRDAEIINDIKFRQTVNESSKVEEKDEVSSDVSYAKGDIAIPAKVEMKVGKNVDIAPGKYTILTTNEERTQINIKIGGYIRVYNHNSEIILAEGDTIMPVSVGIILR